MRCEFCSRWFQLARRSRQVRTGSHLKSLCLRSAWSQSEWMIVVVNLRVFFLLYRLLLKRLDVWVLKIRSWFEVTFWKKFLVLLRVLKWFWGLYWRSTHCKLVVCGILELWLLPIFISLSLGSWIERRSFAMVPVPNVVKYAPNDIFVTRYYQVLCPQVPTGKPGKFFQIAHYFVKISINCCNWRRISVYPFYCSGFTCNFVE